MDPAPTSARRRAHPGSDTRDQILQAAEQLFAARGITSVSLREINRAANQNNTGAVQYHFGDRDGLVREIIIRHRLDSEPRRHALLDQYEDAGRDDLRALSAALVLPIGAKLNDVDRGRAYLRIAGEYYCRPGSFEELLAERDPNNSMERWNALLDTAVPKAARPSLRLRVAAIRFTFVELALRAAVSQQDDDRLFMSHVVDQVTALLGVQPSEATRRLLRLRKVKPSAAG
ncbi:MAG TPA: helix-turn-helix domain-containing protein [Acidimicrobiales bacterium]|jgi:AcrR family transcriptional regulator